MQANTVSPLHIGGLKGFGELYSYNSGNTAPGFFDKADVLAAGGRYFIKPAATKINMEINAIIM